MKSQNFEDEQHSGFWCFKTAERNLLRQGSNKLIEHRIWK
jgi:hypothetical protein